MNLHKVRLNDGTTAPIMDIQGFQVICGACKSAGVLPEPCRVNGESCTCCQECRDICNKFQSVHMETK